MKNINQLIGMALCFMLMMTSCQKENLEQTFSPYTSEQTVGNQEGVVAYLQQEEGLMEELPAGVQVYNQHSDYVKRQNQQFQNSQVAKSRNSFVDNGEDIVFRGGTLIAVQHANGSGARILFDAKSFNPNYHFVTSPVWSNDGRKIAFAAMQRGKSADVFSMNSDGSGVQMIFSGNYAGYFIDGDITDLSWRSDNGSLLFKFHLVQAYLPSFVGSSFQYEHFFATGEQKWAATGLNTVGVQYEPFPNGVQFAYRKESYFAEKLFVNHLGGNVGTESSWWDFYSGYADLTVHSIKEIAWNHSNSIYTVIKASGASNYYNAYRLDKSGNNVRATPIFNSKNVPMTSITVSPNQQLLYSTLKTAEGSKLYLIQLDQNGNFVNAQEMGFGFDPNWRRVKPRAQGRSNGRISNIQHTTSAIHSLMETAVKQDQQFPDKDGVGISITNGVGITASTESKE